MADPKIKLLRIEEIDVSDITDLTTDSLLLTGYQKPVSTSAVLATDDINTAIGKLEKGVEDAALSGGSGDAWGDPVDSDVIPDNNLTRDLGSSINRFDNFYVSNIETTSLKLGTGPGTTRNVIMLSNGTITHTALGGNAVDILVSGVPTNYTPGSGNTQSHLEAIDTALGGLSGGSISPENQRKIDNSRDFVITSKSGDITLTTSDIINSVPNNENKKPILTYTGTDSGIITIPASLGNVGQSIIIDNDGTGTVDVVAGSGTTLFGFGLDGSTPIARMDGSDSNYRYGRVTIVQKSSNNWRIDGNYEAVAAPTSDLFPQDNAASTADINSIGSFVQSTAGILTVSTSIVQNGTYSLAVTSNVSSPYATITVSGATAGVSTTITWWGYEGDTNAFSYGRVLSADIQGNPGDSTTVMDGAAWSQYTLTFIPANTSFGFRIGNGGSTTGLTSYFDNITITQ